MSPGEEDLRSARLATHVVDISADAVAIAERFAGNHLVAAHHTFGAAEIHPHGAELDPLDGAVHDLADAVLVLVILALAFGIAHLLDDNLLRRLRCDAREFYGGKRLGDDVADLGRGIAPARVHHRNLDL